ncbi:hypothetical protein BWR18_13990 [Tateyamaria omphalii]|uniref:Uncharacterized protein n=1 Tax=Tateyamaria omphalii TaxID=299262 RepID=A0A1P8MXC3_9RHOB|nr:hypothetical protein BWR18_13990 [Tateyamaria omphalii]
MQEPPGTWSRARADNEHPPTGQPPATCRKCDNHRKEMRPMFGLIRTAVLILIAFVAGLMFERSQASDACTTQGGTMRDGVCWNE